MAPTLRTGKVMMLTGFGGLGFLGYRRTHQNGSSSASAV
jgi:hypothetical protein